MDDKPAIGRFLRTQLFVLAVALCIGGLAVLGKSVIEQMRGLETANSDNLQWTLTQTSVEYLNLQIALDEVVDGQPQDAPSARARLGERFDVLYSRLDTLASGPVYAALLEDPAFAQNFHLVKALMEEMVPIIDLPDDQLMLRLDELSGLVRRADLPVRELSLKGLARFSTISDQRRQAVTELLVRLAALTLALLLLISLMAFTLLRLYRKSESRAKVLRETSLRLETIIGSSLDGVIVFDRQGKVLDWNGAASRIFGIPQQTAPGRAFFEEILPEDGREAQLERIRDYYYDRSIDGRGPERLTLRARRPDGQIFALELAIATARDATGAINVAFARDIDARLQAEADLKEARDRAVAGQRAKAHFLAVMSHEMRTPLNGLLGALSLLRETALRADQISLLETMDISGRLLLRHVNDVLDVTQFETGQVQPDLHDFDPGQLVADVIASTTALASARGNRLHWQWCSAPVDRMRGDAPRIMQILLNLVSNAIKFTEHGDIAVELRVGPTANAAGQLPVEFRVIDTGIGIAPEDHARIFEDFATVDSSYGRASGGTGLGLGIARRLAALLGGSLGLSSEPGAGSTFWLQLDLAPADPASAAEAASVGAPVSHTPPRQLSVLLVEDNEINRVILRRMIEAAGHLTAEAVNGKEGVDLAALRRFDLILMDISMPVMDGREATRLIRTGHGPSRASPIIGVTAHAMPEEIAEFLACGMDECLQKPIERDRLIRLLDQTAAAAAQADGSDPAPAEVTVNSSSVAALRDTIGAAQVSALVERFVTETDQTLTRIADPDAGPREDSVLAAELHRCAGAAGFLGAADLQAVIRDFEADFKKGQPGALDRARPVLQSVWARTRAELRAAIAPGTAS